MRTERMAGGSERGQAERKRGLAICARAVVSGVWGERSERWWGCGNVGTGKHGRARKFICGAGLRLQCFRTPIWWLLLCFWAKGLHCCCKPNCFGAISTAFLFIFSVSGSVFILFFLVMLKVKCCIFTFNV